MQIEPLGGARRGFGTAEHSATPAPLRTLGWGERRPRESSPSASAAALRWCAQTASSRCLSVCSCCLFCLRCLCRSYWGQAPTKQDLINSLHGPSLLTPPRHRSARPRRARARRQRRAHLAPRRHADHARRRTRRRSDRPARRHARRHRRRRCDAHHGLDPRLPSADPRDGRDGRARHRPQHRRDRRRARVRAVVCTPAAQRGATDPFAALHRSRARDGRHTRAHHHSPCRAAHAARAVHPDGRRLRLRGARARRRSASSASARRCPRPSGAR